MTRQLLINEIQKLYVEKKEKKSDISDEVYILQKYPHIRSLYELYRLHGEKWHQLVREVLFFDSMSIRYMYDRTMQLVRRIGKDPKIYFELKTEIGTYILPDRLSDLNRLLELYETFFCDIFPGLTRRLNLEVITEQHKDRVVTGKIHWARTINDPNNLGLLENPLVFTMTRPETSFETPENVLLTLSILRMKYDSIFLLGCSYDDPLSSVERGILEKIAEGCSRCIELAFLQDFEPEARKYALLDLDDKRILTLESKVYYRTKEHSTQNELFRALLEWRRKYRELQIRVAATFKTRFPLDHIQNIDRMYELWILFEMLDFLANEGSNITVAKFPREFKIVTGKNEYQLFYEKRYEGWSCVDALPDYTIEQKGQIKVVLDAKNWLLEDKKEAMYKMLGYMNNLDTSFGILFFPTESQLKKEKIHFGGNTLKYHKDQCLFNCVLYPSGSSEDYSKKVGKLHELFDLILKKLE